MTRDIVSEILDCYRKGLFPMSDGREDDNVYLVEPKHRALLPIADFHVSRRLKETLRARHYEITINQDFASVIANCAKSKKARESTWINHPIENLFNMLHAQGHAHSVEYREKGILKGGVYGLAVGQIFCAESMYSDVSNASKIALVHMVARLWKAGFQLWDVQFMNPHLEQFGAFEIPQEKYLVQLGQFKDQPADFTLSHLNIDEEDLLKAYLDNR